MAFADQAVEKFKQSSGKPSYASVARAMPKPVLEADFADGAQPEERLTIAKVDQLLEATSNGPVPQHVRQKDNKIYITLQDTADLERARNILEKKPDCSLQVCSNLLKNLM